jgi:hypothetical protein
MNERCTTCGGVKVEGEYIGDSTVCHCAVKISPPSLEAHFICVLRADQYQEIIDRLNRIEANMSGLLLIESSKRTLLPVLEWMLISTLSENDDMRVWAQKHLHEYAMLLNRQEAAE